MRSILVNPTYFPSIAAMALVAQAENVILEAHDNYQKQTYRNRAYIAHTNGRLLLTVPIRHTHQSVRRRTSDVAVENDFPWQSQHWKSIQTAYRTSPFFEYYEDDLFPLFERPVYNLYDHNTRIFSKILELTGLEHKPSESTSYEENPDLIDARSLTIAKTKVTYPLESYQQVFGDRHGFLSNLSVLDLLFNLGPEALAYLQRQKIPLSSNPG